MKNNCPFCDVPCGNYWCPYTQSIIEEKAEEDMKKSELKRLIFERLEFNYSHPEANSRLAEELVQLIEQAGMLPPRVHLPVIGISDNAWESEET
jgi:hypothetical protein